MNGARAGTFEMLRAIFAARLVEEGEEHAGNRANRGTRSVEVSVRGLGVPEIHGDAGAFKGEIILEQDVDIVS